MFLMEDGCCENLAVFSTSDRVINNPKPRQSNMLIKVTVGLLVGVLGYVYQAIKPPIPKPCGSLDGPPVSSPRIRLSDGRYLAYKESGVPKSKARFKTIVVHGFNDAKDFYLPASKEVVEELGVYLLTFDRAGAWFEFYIVGVSLGGYPVWGCLKYIPNRIAGASLVAPIINYWWPSFPSNV
ncbi:hypothetical protein MKW92_017683 [Papaver armeniacum]|nr:hypothetical protein MKW92_017683 [Papaver armeniacum]